MADEASGPTVPTVPAATVVPVRISLLCGYSRGIHAQVLVFLSQKPMHRAKNGVTSKLSQRNIGSVLFVAHV